MLHHVEEDTSMDMEQGYYKDGFAAGSFVIRSPIMGYTEIHGFDVTPMMMLRYGGHAVV